MNWTMIGLLALPGLLMGLLSTQGLTRGIEPYLWVILGLFASLVVARMAGGQYFLHGLCIGVAWGVINGLMQSALFSMYAAHNPDVMQRMAGRPSPIPPRVFFMVSAPIIGLVTGLVLGLLCWAGHRVVHPAPPVANAQSPMAQSPV